MEKLITLLVPAYNEEEVIGDFYEETTSVLNQVNSLKYNFEILFINDGSTDRTLSIIKQIREKDKRVCYIDLSRNFGKEIALASGFDNVSKSTDALIILDADLQDPPALILKMIEQWENGYDDVYAKRTSRKGETFFKKITSYLFYRVLSFFSDIPIQKDTGDFRLLDKKVLKALQDIRESQRYTKGLFSWVGFNKKEIEFLREPRKAGKTKWNYLKLFNLAIEGITSFTVAPLRVSIILGFIISILSFILMIKVFFQALFSGIDVKGYPSLMVIITFLGGVQLLSIGLIGEYLGRIFKETKKRPLYFVKEKSVNEN